MPLTKAKGNIVKNQQNYQQSDKGKEIRRKYRKTPKNKEYRRKYQRKYYHDVIKKKVNEK